MSCETFRRSYSLSVIKSLKSDSSALHTEALSFSYSSAALHPTAL